MYVYWLLSFFELSIFVRCFKQQYINYVHFSFRLLGGEHHVLRLDVAVRDRLLVGVPWLRTNVVDTKGTAAKVTHLDRLGKKRYALVLSGV